jgi:ferredoxin
VRVRVDSSKCSGHGLCYVVNPLLFPIGNNGYSVLQPREVKPQDEEVTREAVAACPDLALILEDS